MKGPRRRLLLLAERASWAFGLVGLLSWGAFHIEAATSTRHDLERFAALQVVARKLAAGPVSLVPSSCQRLAQSVKRSGPRSARGAPNPEDSTRGAGAARHRRPHARPRRRSYRGHGTTGNGRELGHRRAPGWLLPRTEGHRPGDAIELDTLQGTDVYRVERTWVVNPEDVSVLDPTSTRALTLVTCYPFYFIAPPPSGSSSVPCASTTGAVSPPSTEPALSPRADAGVVASSRPLGLANDRVKRQKWRESYDTCNESGGPGCGGRVSDGRRVAGAADVDLVGNQVFEVSRWTATCWSSGCRKARGS